MNESNAQHKTTIVVGFLFLVLASFAAGFFITSWRIPNKSLLKTRDISEWRRAEMFYPGIVFDYPAGWHVASYSGFALVRGKEKETAYIEINPEPIDYHIPPEGVPGDISIYDWGAYLENDNYEQLFYKEIERTKERATEISETIRDEDDRLMYKIEGKTRNIYSQETEPFIIYYLWIKEGSVNTGQQVLSVQLNNHQSQYKEIYEHIAESIKVNIDTP